MSEKSGGWLTGLLIGGALGLGLGLLLGKKGHAQEMKGAKDTKALPTEPEPEIIDVEIA